MNNYRWTVRVGLGGVGFLVILAAFVAVILIFNLVVAGVQPEAWALGAMMTAPFTIGVVLLATVGTALAETVIRLRGTVNGYRWTLRVGLGGVVFLATLIVFVAVTRIFNVVIAGVQPEAWALGAMMTAPFTIGVVLLATGGTALVEKLVRFKRRAVGA